MMFRRPSIVTVSDLQEYTDHESLSENHRLLDEYEPPEEFVLSEDERPSRRSFCARVLPVVACGSGLFSVGYIGSALYSGDYLQIVGPRSSFFYYIGYVVGLLPLGYVSDRWSRKNALLVSTTILVLFTVQAAIVTLDFRDWYPPITNISWATRWFFLGIAVGGEHTAGSVALSEAAEELKGCIRNRYFILFNNGAIILGSLIGSFVSYVCTLVFTNHSHAARHVILGLQVVLLIAVLLMRLRLQEPKQPSGNNMRNCRLPYSLIIKGYRKRLAIISLVWFLYQYFWTYILNCFIFFFRHSLNYGTQGYELQTIINLCRLAAAVSGALLSNWTISNLPPLTIITNFICEILLFICLVLPRLPTYDTPLMALYAIILFLGEFTFGNNISLVAAKSSPSAVRGQYYSVAAAIGKMGAVVSSYLHPRFIMDGQDPETLIHLPYLMAVLMILFAAMSASKALPDLQQDAITSEDRHLREYLDSQGWDTRLMGNTIDSFSDNDTTGVLVTLDVN